MQNSIYAEKFLGLDFIEAPDENAFEELSLALHGFHDVEMEKEKFINLREQAAMLMHIIHGDTQIFYPTVTRIKFEVRNGYKEAVRRGARLFETEVFNLLFQFRGHLRGDGIALMCHGPEGQEWIMLCPDDTKRRIEEETYQYKSIASRLVFEMKMDSDVQNSLLENLNLLLIGTRCANSLEHEYGHVLQHRMWAAEGILPNDHYGLYEWFYKNDYADNVSQRVPKFADKPDEVKVYLLKEAFVEDYRIGLNLSYNKGIFELPNAYCFFADFQRPEWMEEGVNIVRKILKEKNMVKSQYQASYEPDRIAVIDQIMQDARDFNLGKSRMTPADHQAVLNRLRAKQPHLS